VTQFLNLTLGGISSGAVYASVALALVLIWRSTRIVNFAQGGMLMFTTFIAYAVIQGTGSYWLAFFVALISGFVLGGVVERVLIRHVEDAPPLNAVIVTLGLLIFIEAVAGMIRQSGGRAIFAHTDVSSEISAQACAQAALSIAASAS